MIAMLEDDPEIGHFTVDFHGNGESVISFSRDECEQDIEIIIRCKD